MKNFYTLIFAVFISVFSADAQVSQQWLQRYDFDGTATSDIATAMTIDDDGNVYVTGRGGALGNTDIITIKYSPAGDMVWTEVWNGPNNSYDGANAITIEGDFIYVTGYTEDPPLINSNRRKDFATLKYSLGGSFQWAAYYNFSPENNWEDIAYAVDADEQGNVYVTGSSKDAMPQVGYRDIATIKYNSSGAEQWVARYNHPDEGGPGTNDDVPVALRTDAEGNVYVCGWSVDMNSGIDYVTLKYSNSGEDLWEQRYTMPGSFADTPAAMQLDENGTVYVTGTSSGFGADTALKDDYATIKYATNGDVLWVRRFDSAVTTVANDAASDLAVDASGNVYVTGDVPSATTFGHDYYTIKYDAAGTVVWESRWDALGFEDRPKKMKLDASGNIYITGFSTNPNGTMNYATIKLNNSGQFQWSQMYQTDSGSQHLANDIVVDSNQDVIVTGQSYFYGDDYVTIKYSQVLSAESFEGGARAILYPNPVADAAYLTMAGDGAMKSAMLIDMNGRIIRKWSGSVQGPGGMITLDMQGVSPAFYLLTLELDSGTSTFKVCKQ